MLSAVFAHLLVGPPLARVAASGRRCDVMSMHKLTAGDGYAYLTRHVAVGDAGLDAGASLTAYYEQTGNPQGRWFGEGLAGLGDASRRLRPGDVVSEHAMTAVFRDGVDPLTDDALGRPYPRFDTTERRAVVSKRGYGRPSASPVPGSWPSRKTAVIAGSLT